MQELAPWHTLSSSGQARIFTRLDAMSDNDIRTSTHLDEGAFAYSRHPHHRDEDMMRFNSITTSEQSSVTKIAGMVYK